MAINLDILTNACVNIVLASYIVYNGGDIATVKIESSYKPQQKYIEFLSSLGENEADALELPTINSNRSFGLKSSDTTDISDLPENYMTSVYMECQTILNNKLKLKHEKILRFLKLFDPPINQQLSPIDEPQYGDNIVDNYLLYDKFLESYFEADKNADKMLKDLADIRLIP
jgi:hypothetical protein